MTAVAAPMGLQAVYHPSGLERAMQFQIPTSYATSIFKGDPVILDNTTNVGQLKIGAAATALLGVFIGCEYTDATGKPTFANYWPGGQSTLTGTITTAWVVTDPETVYEIQAAGSLAQLAVGKEYDVIMGSGNTSTGLSTTSLNTVAAANGGQKQFRVVDFGRSPDNAAGDAYTVVRVTLAQSQLRAVAPAI